MLHWMGSDIPIRFMQGPAKQASTGIIHYEKGIVIYTDTTVYNSVYIDVIAYTCV